MSGVVSDSNSLVGSTAGDKAGTAGRIVISSIADTYGVTALTNGNYVVASINWSNGAASKAGAVTWGSGASGVSGAISASNSLVGSQANDQVGYGGQAIANGITALANGNYVVRSPFWSIDATTATQIGAVTWGSGASGVSGALVPATAWWVVIVAIGLAMTALSNWPMATMWCAVISGRTMARQSISAPSPGAAARAA